MGGWGHTVTLCPLTEVEPTGQDFGKCASFAVVSTHQVSANVSMKAVSKSSTGFGSPRDARKSGITVSLTPVEGKNLGGDGRTFTTRVERRPDDRYRRAHDTPFRMPGMVNGILTPWRPAATCSVFLKTGWGRWAT